MFKMKRKKNENGEEMENAYDVFKRNYDNVPGFKALIKLFGYGLFIIILLVIASTANTGNSKANEETKTTTTTTVSQKKVYGDILNELKTVDKSVDITIKKGAETFTIEGKNEEKQFSGYYSDITGTKKFIIRENNIYEKTLDQEIMNNNLLGTIDKDFIVPAYFVDYIISSSAIKTFEDDTTIYMYNVTKNNINYEIKNYLKSEKCYKIEINSSDINYLITYK